MKVGGELIELRPKPSIQKENLETAKPGPAYFVVQMAAQSGATLGHLCTKLMVGFSCEVSSYFFFFSPSARLVEGQVSVEQKLLGLNNFYIHSFCQFVSKKFRLMRLMRYPEARPSQGEISREHL